MSRPRARALPEAAIRSAIAWQLRLESSGQQQRLHAQIDEWRAQHPDHDLAWQRLRSLGAELDDMTSRLPGPDLSMRLLDQADTDLQRRHALKLLGIALAVGAPAGWLTHRAVNSADLQTEAGVQQQQALPGGVEVQLNTRSALDVAAGPNTLQLNLREGEVLIDSLQSIPSFELNLQCRWGRCQAGQVRYVVRDYEQYSQISVEQGHLMLQAAGQHYQAKAGEVLRLTQSGIVNAAPALDPLAWSRGMLVADNLTLGAFIAELARYRTGLLGCDPAVAGLRLSGVFQLAEPNALLDDLPRILPVRLIARTRWWLRVVAA